MNQTLQLHHTFVVLTIIINNIISITGTNIAARQTRESTQKLQEMAHASDEISIGLLMLNPCRWTIKSRYITSRESHRKDLKYRPGQFLKRRSTGPSQLLQISRTSKRGTSVMGPCSPRQRQLEHNTESGNLVHEGIGSLVNLCAYVVLDRFDLRGVTNDVGRTIEIRSSPLPFVGSLLPRARALAILA
jgi:hypothetical protein